MRTLVTGGAGFIGSHLCERLLAEGHEVTCLDNFFTGRRENTAVLAGNPRFRIVDHDVTEPYDADVEWIFNLACPASPVHYQIDPIATLRTSVLGILNALALAERTGARVLQASTSEVYGDPIVHPQPETYWGNVNPVGPRACYDEGKRAAETLMSDFHRHRGIDIRIARIFNTYGPRMAIEDGRVISNFVVQALRDEPMTVYGDGEQTRSFCYIDDLVDGLMRLMTTPGVHEPVNLGNPREFTMRQVAQLVADMCGRPGELAFRPLPQDDPIQRKPVIERARHLLGWEPVVALRDGLRPTIEDFRGRI